MTITAILRGGGDLASGAALRMNRAGIGVIITELAQPMAVRRSVSFAQAVYDGEIVIEGVKGKLARDVEEAQDLLAAANIAVLVDPGCNVRKVIESSVLVDGRMTKRPPDLGMDAAELVIGLGPGFVAGINCHAVVETKRGPFLGRVYYQGSAEPDSGQPDAVGEHQADRVLRAPTTGILQAYAEIGDHLEAGQIIAGVDRQPVRAAFAGVLRGLVMQGLKVPAGEKIGDLDPRDDPRLCRMVSEKALAVGGGVMEAILRRTDLRTALGS